MPDGRDQAHIGHGNFRPSMTPKGQEGLEQPDFIPEFGQREGMIPSPWGGEVSPVCQAIKKDGSACQANATKDGPYCYFHTQKD